MTEKSFAALRHPGYRAYFIGAAVAMMGDSIEHVIRIGSKPKEAA